MRRLLLSSLTKITTTFLYFLLFPEEMVKITLPAPLEAFFSFLAGKLRNFPNLTLGEQISYSSIGGGLLLILIAIVLFIV